MKTKIYLFAVIIVAVLFNGCAKDGAPGKDGVNGTNGNANVQSYTYYNKSWVNSGSSILVTESALTQVILDKGVVDVYWREAGTTEWISVPNAYTAVSMGVGYVEIFPASGWGYLPMDVKIVIIPSS